MTGYELLPETLRNLVDQLQIETNFLPELTLESLNLNLTNIEEKISGTNITTITGGGEEGLSGVNITGFYWGILGFLTSCFLSALCVGCGYLALKKKQVSISKKKNVEY